jgi:predicted Fe-Mo cluster-binding NifX family protein
MDKRSLRFAFAVNHKNEFESNNFCGADMFLIYDWVNNDFIHQNDEANPFKNDDDDNAIGSERNVMAIIDSLKNLGIDVLVSTKFGENIKMVNHNFIPVIVFSDTPDEVKRVLKKHIKWIEDELRNRPKEFKLFKIKNGIMKTSVKDNQELFVSGS